MYNIHVQHTCTTYMYNIHVQHTCTTYMYNIQIWRGAGVSREVEEEKWGQGFSDKVEDYRIYSGLGVKPILGR